MTASRATPSPALPIEQDRRVIARSYVLLFGSGATLVLATLPLVAGQGYLPGLIGPLLAAYATVAVLMTCAERLSLLAYKLAPLLGAALSSAVIASAGSAEAAQAYAFFYCWVMISAAYFFPERWVSALALGTMAIMYGAIVIAVGHEHGLLSWVMTMGALMVLALLVNSLVRRRASIERARRDAEKRFRSAFDDAAVGMALTSLDGTWTSVNPALAELLGYPPEQLVGMRFSAVTHPDDRGRDLDALKQLVAGERDRYVTTKRYVRADGTTIWALLSVSTVRGDDASPRYMIAQMQDITERKQAEERLAHQALHDGLTGVANRTLLLDRLEVALRHAERRSRPLALLFVDVDRFKLVNDRFGHAGGDRLLIDVAQRLRGAVRDEDTVARFAGDAFVVLCEELAGVTDAERLAGRIRDAMAAPFAVGDETVPLTVSIGVALAEEGARSADELLGRADEAMFEAKQGGRSSHLWTRPQPGAHGEITEGDLRRALRRDELRLHYQPQVTAEGGIVGFEALLRWEHPERGLLAPAAFLATGERSGAIVEIGDWVLATACAQLSGWLDAGAPRSLQVAVNLSARELTMPGLVERVRRAVADHGLDPANLCLEVTESSVLTDVDATAGTVAALQEAGVKVALDDFGTGFSTLLRLNTLPTVDMLKVSRCFVSRVDSDPTARAIVRSLVELARSLGIAVIAEGVETEVQATILATLGCELAQGYHHGRPAPAAAAGRLLAIEGPGEPAYQR